MCLGNSSEFQPARQLFTGTDPRATSTLGNLINKHMRPLYRLNLTMAGEAPVASSVAAMISMLT